MSDWVKDLMEDLYDRKNAKPVDLAKCPKGARHCPKCKGTGIGQPGEMYEEMGTRTYGCSECHSFGYV